MTDTPATEAQSVGSADVAPEAANTGTGTPVAVRVLYVAGVLAATILTGSVLFIASAYAVSGDGAFGVDISVRALVIWVGLMLAAAGTWLWRRVRRRA